jgi:hypothetical protein
MTMRELYLQLLFFLTINFFFMPSLIYPPYPTGGPSRLHDSAGRVDKQVAIVFEATSGFGPSKSSGTIQGAFKDAYVAKLYYDTPNTSSGALTYTPPTAIPVRADEDRNVDGITDPTERTDDDTREQFLGF